jgi:hypothetical protein
MENLTVKMELPEDGADECQKDIRVLVKQCNVVYEKQCIKRWFDEDR